MAYELPQRCGNVHVYRELLYLYTFTFYFSYRGHRPTCSNAVNALESLMSQLSLVDIPIPVKLLKLLY